MITEPEENPCVALNNARNLPREDSLLLAEQVERIKARHEAAKAPRTSAIVADDSTPLTALPDAIARLQELCPPKSDGEMRAWRWENEILPNLKASRLPHRFHREIHEWTEPKQRTVFERCKTLFTQTGAIVALVGERGLGKTTIAGQLVIERAWDETRAPWARRPPYRKMTDLIAQFKPLYADFGSIQTEELMERRDGFCKLHPLVIIDELHECDDMKLKDRVLTDILDRRYANHNDTLLITNQTPAEFKQTTNDSILSRLSEHGRIIECKWNSFRDKQ